MESKRVFFCGSHGLSGNQHLQTQCYFHTFPLRRFLSVLPNHTFKRPKIDRLWIHLYNHLYTYIWLIFEIGVCLLCFSSIFQSLKEAMVLLNRLPIGPVQRHEVNSLRGQLEKKDAELDAAGQRGWRWMVDDGENGLKMVGWLFWNFSKWCMEPCCWCCFDCHRIGWYSIYQIDDAWHGRS